MKTNDSLSQESQNLINTLLVLRNTLSQIAGAIDGFEQSADFISPKLTGKADKITSLFNDIEGIVADYIGESVAMDLYFKNQNSEN